MHNFLKSNMDTPNNSDELALIVIVEEQSNVNLEDETQDNVEINVITMWVIMNTYLIHLLQNLLVLMRNQFMWIFIDNFAYRNVMIKF